MSRTLSFLRGNSWMLVAEVKTREKDGEMVRSIWYVKDVGPVKIVTRNGKESVTWELELVVKGYTLDESGKLVVPTVGELLKLDGDSSVIMLIGGKTVEQKPYWMYIAVRPSKYKEFKEAIKDGKNLRFTDYGVVVKYGYDEKVPAAVKEEMRLKYGSEENYMDKVVNQIRDTKNVFLRHQEARRIFDVVEMLQKKRPDVLRNGS